ncbi:hypothetical protein CAEBREN_24025 [Caenorhabditis brenneri]|uniref:Uncharacterized protein n=1 Tax=Caenorhabditis brenneri TaxID=135651 RepID=G0NGM9_CAEBE|nr:hypothetical protein CAEBREN_24025 [Caenorhabditis brenneri]
MGDIIEEIELRELQEERLVYMEEGYEDHEEYIPDVHVEEVPSVPKLDFNYVLVDMGILMDTLSFCQRCSSRDVQIKPQKCMGAAVSKLQQFFEVLQVPHLTERAHFNIVSKRIAPAIEEAFTKMQEDVIRIVVAKGDETGEINVAGDAMYDSPGFSAIVCRYALLCVETGLVVEVEAMRKERNESSKAQEPKALEIALRRLENRVAATGTDVFVGSITTDRDMCVGKMLSEKFSHIEAYYDIWHFVKNLQKALWKKKDYVGMIPVKHWLKPMCNHLYHSISSSFGDGQLATEKFMSFFLHIQGQHRAFNMIEHFHFTTFKKCEHGRLKKRLCSEITGQTKNERVEKKMNGSNKKMNGSNEKMNGSNKKMNGSNKKTNGSNKKNERVNQLIDPGVKKK